ncbi:39S ribosomal protein L48, mitochondrial [Cololabis saira]|uniref:39S ribosomal protein L48, mitochondrial n=1 Tax=Cololabis saira TaxID=129043 RepID=UPI002AD1D96B|nr:39S ribosomal protein L48, mitochondrial [Cololabis saira]
MPTHGIGRWKYLLPKQAPKKKKDKIQMKQMFAATDTAYGTLNVNVSGYDMTVVEHYSQYIHNVCNRLGINVAESYALPTKTTEVMLMQEQGTKTYVDAVLKTHERVVQLSSLNTAMCPVFMDLLLKNQPEGVQLSVKEHTEGDFQARFKARPELEGLMAQISY